MTYETENSRHKLENITIRETFHKNATDKDIDTLVGFCSDSLGIDPVRNVGTK